MADVPLEIREILNAQEMKGELLVNHFRVAFNILCIGMLSTMLDVNTAAANRVYLIQGVAWLSFALAVYGILRMLKGHYLWWLKYITITVDVCLAGCTVFASASNHTGVLEYFLLFMPQLGVFWNLMSGFRFSMGAGIYSALLTTLTNGAIIYWAVSTGLVPVSPVSVFGTPAINISDEVNTLFFVSLPGVLAAVIARIARGLVQRAEEESLKRARLEKERDRLGRYLSKNLVELILQNPDKLELGGSRRQATIMFTDIRNFTPYSETREPEEVVRFLNDYFTRMHEIVFRYGGTLDKYLGDGLMVEFGVPFPGYHAPLRAVIAALEMIETVRKMNETGQIPGHPTIEIGAGISTGPVVAGDIGSLERMEYTCIGDTVNFASRLEGLNRRLGSNITICERTRAALPAGVLQIHHHPDVEVKGKREPVVLYTIETASDIPALIARLRRELDRVETVELQLPAGVAVADHPSSGVH